MLRQSLHSLGWILFPYLKAEVAVRLAEFIVENSERLVDEWENFARTAEPASAVMSREDLRNFVSAMLESIVEDMQTAQTLEEEFAKAHGLELNGAQKSTGERHGRARQSFKFSIQQLFSEYRALRASILRFWYKSGAASGNTDIEDITRFNEAIDELIASSIASFVKANEEAAEAEILHREEFLAMLAHELRNPLSPIDSASELLQAGKLDAIQIQRTSQIIGRQVRHMSSLINDLLDASRVTHGMITLQLKKIDLRNVANAAIEQTKPLMENRHHHLILNFPSEPVYLNGDSQRLTQVFANLLNNAAKYTPADGLISLSIETVNDNAIVHVTDNGLGMEPELINRAFDLFSQGERSSDRLLGGLGLGLALVKSLVDLHKGHASCQSNGLGAGTRFIVSLPKLAVLPNAEASDMRPAPIRTQQAISHRIMIVDDNVDAASMLAMLLEIDGHEVLTEHAAKPALVTSGNFMPDVFLLYIGLPDMDGNRLARSLRENNNNSTALFVAITGYSQENDRETTTAAGFDHHLVKPVDFQILGKILRNFRRRDVKNHKSH